MHFWFALLSVIGFVLAAFAHAAGWMALGLTVGFVFAILAVFAFVGSRIGNGARLESISDVELETLRRSLQPLRSDSEQTPPR